jgi:2-hydroxy fatty acid dioxygenase
MVLSLLTATSFAARDPNHMIIAGAVQGLSWLAQLLGHAFAERRAPAFVDNLLGGTSFINLSKHPSLILALAFVLAPFFVHLEILFFLGYRPAMHKRIMNEIGKEITKVRREQGDKKRAAEKKSS